MFQATAEALLALCPLAGPVACGLVSRGLLYEARLDGWCELPEDATSIVHDMMHRFDSTALAWIIRDGRVLHPDYRLIIPWRGPDGTISEVQRRFAPCYGTEAPLDGQAKYRWPARSSFAPSTRYAYGISTLTPGVADEIWIVEGACDVLAVRALHRARDVARKVAVLGIPGVETWCTYRDSVLPHLANRVVCVAFDSDRAGQDAAQKTLSDIQCAHPREVKHAKVPHGKKDWTDLAQDRLWQSELHEARCVRLARELAYDMRGAT